MCVISSSQYESWLIFRRMIISRDILSLPRNTDLGWSLSSYLNHSPYSFSLMISAVETNSLSFFVVRCSRRGLHLAVSPKGSMNFSWNRGWVGRFSVVFVGGQFAAHAPGTQQLTQSKHRGLFVKSSRFWPLAVRDKQISTPSQKMVEGSSKKSL